MSTTYAVFRNGLKPNIEKLEDYDEGEDYVIIGQTWGFDYKVKALIDYMGWETPVYAIDNDTDITNLGELRRYYEKV